MQLIFGHDEALIGWAQERYPEVMQIGGFARPATTIGLWDGKSIQAVAIFNNFCHYDVQVSFVASTPRWATKGSIRAILSYPFRQLRVKRMTAITAKSNKRSRKLLKGLGFQLEGVHPFGNYGAGPSVSYGLYANVAEQKWLNGVPNG